MSKVIQDRTYVVTLQNSVSGEILEYFVIPVIRSSQSAKAKALKKAKSLQKEYLNNAGSSIILLCSVNTEHDQLYLNPQGEEDTIPTDWLDL